jgi:hypothetical protein
MENMVCLKLSNQYLDMSRSAATDLRTGKNLKNFETILYGALVELHVLHVYRCRLVAIVRGFATYLVLT